MLNNLFIRNKHIFELSRKIEFVPCEKWLQVHERQSTQIRPSQSAAENDSKTRFCLLHTNILKSKQARFSGDSWIYLFIHFMFKSCNFMPSQTYDGVSDNTPTRLLVRVLFVWIFEIIKQNSAHLCHFWELSVQKDLLMKKSTSWLIADGNISEGLDYSLGRISRVGCYSYQQTKATTFFLMWLTVV